MKIQTTLSKRKIILFLFVLLFISVLNAKRNYPIFNQLTIKDGLSSHEVTCFLQDKQGFIWIGTDDGLNKYDGHQVQIFRNNLQDPNTIGGNSIRCLFEDSKGNLWIGLKGKGLCRLNLSTLEFKTFKHEIGNTKSLSYNDVAGMVEDSDGKLWIAVDRGSLDMLDINTETFTHYPICDARRQPMNNALTDIVMNRMGNLWIASWGGGIYYFDTKKKTFIDYSINFNTEDKFCKHIFNIYIDESDIIWIGTAHGGLFKIDPKIKNKLPYTHIKSIQNRTIRHISEDDRKNLWIATTGEGIKVLNKKTEDIIISFTSETNNNRNLLSNSLNRIYKDRDGTMWIGTHIGVNYFNLLSNQFNLTITQHEDDNAKSDNQLLSILKDHENNIWIGDNNNLEKYDQYGSLKSKYKLDNLKYSDSYRYNQAICEDKKGNIWVGSYSDLLIKYSPATGNFKRIQIESTDKTKLPYSNVYNIYEDKNNTLWIMTEIGTVNYNPETKVFTPLFQSNKIIYPEDKSHVFYSDRNGFIWVGTEGGLRKYDKALKLLRIYTTQDNKNQITNDFITAIYEDKKNNFWIGTRGGLHRLDRKNERFELIKQTGKLYGDPIFGICEDSKGNLWISTAFEIIKYNTTTHIFHVYDSSDGLMEDGYKQGAFFHAKDGQILVGGKRGYITFYPDSLLINKKTIPVIITDFQIFNKSIVPEKDGILINQISETKNIILKHSHSVITFKFVAINFISPKKNKYAYMLEGFDKEWTYTNSDHRSATYTNLNSGKYVFKVKVANNDGIWNNDSTNIAIKILPPFWKSNIALLLYFIIISIITILINRQFIVRERDKNKLRMAELEAEQTHEMELLRTTLFTNISHEFRTPLTLIQGPLNRIIEKGNFKEEDQTLYKLMYRNTQRLLRLVNQFLDFRKLEAGKLSLNLIYDDIIRFIIELTNTFTFYASEKNIQLIVVNEITELRMNFDPDKLDKIMYNLISNALQYTPENGKVEVLLSEISLNGKLDLQIQVKDTGIGILQEGIEELFSVFYQEKRSSKTVDGFGIGLALTRELVEMHGGKIIVRSEIDKGSTFEVLLPINKKLNIEKINPIELLDILPSEIIDRKDTYQNYSNDIVKSEIKSCHKETLLIVEDNFDMRLYIREILSNQFNVYEAKDGQEGYCLASEIVPDIIISDVMMPNMDGLELTKALRENQTTNHIPIILLTARNSETQVVEGIKMGVEDYITKPFSASILEARIHNILTTRKKMWEIYKQSSAISEYEEKLSDNPLKKEFITKINAIITAHISEPEFGIEILGEELRMSVNQLFRKVKAIMDTTPYNIIVQVRMTHAVSLIRTTDKNISEIAYEVGYQELSNFSRAFKKYFNVSPTQFIKECR